MLFDMINDAINEAELESKNSEHSKNGWNRLRENLITLKDILKDDMSFNKYLIMPHELAGTEPDLLETRFTGNINNIDYSILLLAREPETLSPDHNYQRLGNIQVLGLGLDSVSFDRRDIKIFYAIASLSKCRLYKINEPSVELDFHAHNVLLDNIYRSVYGSDDLCFKSRIMNFDNAAYVNRIGKIIGYVQQASIKAQRYLDKENESIVRIAWDL